jgi:hypothetical protein
MCYVCDIFFFYDKFIDLVQIVYSHNYFKHNSLNNLDRITPSLWIVMKTWTGADMSRYAAHPSTLTNFQSVHVLSQMLFFAFCMMHDT